MAHNILLWIEIFRGQAVPVSYECLGEAKKLAAGGTVTAAVFGEKAAIIASEAISFGADQAMVCEDATLADYRAEPHIALLAKVAADLTEERAAVATRGIRVDTNPKLHLSVFGELRISGFQSLPNFDSQLNRIHHTCKLSEIIIP